MQNKPMPDAIARLRGLNAELAALLQEWLDTELDSQDEEFMPWIESFEARVTAALARLEEGK